MLLLWEMQGRSRHLGRMIIARRAVDNSRHEYELNENIQNFTFPGLNEPPEQGAMIFGFNDINEHRKMRAQASGWVLSGDFWEKHWRYFARGILR